MTASPPPPTTIPRDIAPALRTGRLLLRRARAGDGQAIHEAVVESLDDLRAWPASLPWARAEPSVAASEAFARESEAAFAARTTLTYFAFNAEGRFVASTSLQNIDWSVPQFEVGFWCRTSSHRKGYGQEAVGALVQYALTGLDARRVYSLTDARNTASRALCERVGLQFEGVLEHERADPQGVLRDTCVYAVTR
ncbi:GNAT family N-acetyltransferase [Pseudorhodoferax sp. Leaf267]|uniref:GNAT family N-acetyltransferase n=1 Tax=Pseudorhodoferax sp. Leaf267 TaxID=1736316 RepID=UPI0006FBD07C|nr:GNAT family N-acetyltransferase [Pseudorhodoferax sp. Leaf267]KQP23509.1 GCN5 family acetyltransferase [Pseudorhodoferax sp. Leaf267]